jgi:hypothetical protein
MADEPMPRTPILDDLVLSLVRLYYRNYRSNARKVREQAERFQNSPSLSDDFLDNATMVTSATSVAGGTHLWDIALINGSSRLSMPPHGEAGDIVIQDSLLKLRVRHDPAFDRKSPKWRKGIPAAERYNNAYVVGFKGFMPTPKQSIHVACRMKISPGFHGSTGIWVQEVDTFDPQTGIMIKPFRSFGFSYLGEASDPYIQGLATETVIGLSIQDKHTVRNINVAQWHDYSMRWSWISQNTQRVEFTIDDQSVGGFRMYPFGPAEIQLWADNYQIHKGLRIGYLNVPDVDEASYDWVRCTIVDM